jgi:hypothetical protein
MRQEISHVKTEWARCDKTTVIGAGVKLKMSLAALTAERTRQTNQNRILLETATPNMGV